MSTTARDYSSILRKSIYTVLNGNVTVAFTADNTVITADDDITPVNASYTYPVFKDPIRGQPNRAYVMIGTIIDTESGPKDNFVYQGSVSIEVVDESQTINPTRDLSETMNNVVRKTLKTTKGGVFTVTDFTLTYFRHGGSTRMEEKLPDGRKSYRIIDIYEYAIQ